MTDREREELGIVDASGDNSGNKQYEEDFKEFKGMIAIAPILKYYDSEELTMLHVSLEMGPETTMLQGPSDI